MLCHPEYHPIACAAECLRHAHAKRFSVNDAEQLVDSKLHFVGDSEHLINAKYDVVDYSKPYSIGYPECQYPSDTVIEQ